MSYDDDMSKAQQREWWENKEKLEWMMMNIKLCNECCQIIHFPHKYTPINNASRVDIFNDDDDENERKRRVTWGKQGKDR